LNIQSPQVPPTATPVALTTVRVSIRRVIDESYPVVIGNNLAPIIAERLFEPDLVDYQVAIITDENVRAGMAETIRSELAERGRRAHVVAFPAGERYKTRQTKATVEDTLIEAGCGRDTCILAVGGGVVTDMAGFVAATLARGVPFINVPTTILAAADASIGGKTGVDTAAATNLIGAFHQPRAVYIDLATWATLPAEQIQSGLAETIKHACLADKDFFALLEKVFVDQGRAPEELVGDDELMRQIAQHNTEIKARFVTGDVYESNVRMVLNLGHTFGRALEAAEDYTISHGRAVAIGLMLQAQWGAELGFVTDVDLDRLRRLLESVGLPTALPASTTNEQLVAKMLHDKKTLGGVVRFVFQQGIGDIQTFEHGSVARPAGIEEILKFLVQVRR
jgi:3-dehydroquinate synthase